MNIIDISISIHNNMWHYKPQWKNYVELFESTIKGDVSTVYKLNIYSHTGTYIETSSHKLPSELLLNDLPLNNFYRNVKLIVVRDEKIITKNSVQEESQKNNLKIEKGDAVIIANGYGKNHDCEDYLSDSPSFEPELTEWLIEQELGLLGVDTPIIENLTSPYQPVVKLFKANKKLLLLAPLNIDIKTIATSEYILSCFPLSVEKTTGMLCRAVLIKQ